MKERPKRDTNDLKRKRDNVGSIGKLIHICMHLHTCIYDIYTHTYIHTHTYIKLMVKSTGFEAINYYIHKVKIELHKKGIARKQDSVLDN